MPLLSAYFAVWRVQYWFFRKNALRQKSTQSESIFVFLFSGRATNGYFLQGWPLGGQWWVILVVRRDLLIYFFFLKEEATIWICWVHQLTCCVVVWQRSDRSGDNMELRKTFSKPVTAWDLQCTQCVHSWKLLWVKHLPGLLFFWTFRNDV